MNRKNLAISIIGVLVIAAVCAGTYWILKSDKNIAFNQIEAKNGEVVKEIKAIGLVKPAENINLSWEKSGKIIAIGAKVGDRVSSGQVLATLDATDLSAQLNQAQSNVLAAQAQMDQLKNGARPEELSIKKTELDQAQQTLANYYDNAFVALNDAFAKADEALHRDTADLYVNGDTNSAKLSFLTSDSQLEVNLNQKRFQSVSDLKQWESELRGIADSSDHASIDAQIIKTKAYLSDVRDFLNLAADAVNSSASWSASYIASEKIIVNAGRTSVNAAALNINSQDQAISAQKINVSRIQQEYNLKVTGARSEDISAQAARVAQAQAAVDIVRAAISKNYLKSPINGLVSVYNAKVGEAANPGSIAAVIISDSQSEIEIRLSEADIAKVKIGDDAAVTLDAYGDKIFNAKIISIDPSPSAGADGVNGYKVRLQMSQNYSEIKSDMTANVRIQVEKKSNVVILPQSALIRNNDEYYIMDQSNSRKKIETGLWGSDGQVEIISGVKAGDVILGL